MSEEQKRARWSADAARLRDEVTHLVWLRTTHRRLQAIIRANERLDVPSPMLDFLVEGYVAAASTGVRRVVYTSGSAICFARLLNDLKKHLPLLTRDQLSSLYGTHFRHTYDKVLGHARGNLSAAEIDADLRALQADADIVKHYVDERVAHISRTPRDDVPKFEDLHRAIGHLERAVLKYSALLTGENFAHLDPLQSPDLTEVLTFPWIHDDSD